MGIQSWHQLLADLTIRLFEHDHLWLHLIVHVVLVIMPTLFLGILLWFLLRLRFHQLIGIVGISEKLDRTTASFYKIPNHILAFHWNRKAREDLPKDLGAN